MDAAFDPWHLLYRRCVVDDVDGDRLIGARIRYDDVSVNWSKYSKPWDVIFDYPNEGIARFIVRDLPKDLPKETPPPPPNPKKKPKPVNIHSFDPVHDPKEDNYSHTEIATFKDGNRVRKPSLSVTTKKEFRTIMADRSLVMLRPRV